MAANAGRGGLRLLLATPEGKRFEGPIAQVAAPGAQGAFAVRAGHAAFMSALEAGVVQVRGDGGEQQFVIDGGFLEVRDNDVVLLANWSEPLEAGADAVELIRAQRARAAKAAAL